MVGRMEYMIVEVDNFSEWERAKSSVRNRGEIISRRGNSVQSDRVA